MHVSTHISPKSRSRWSQPRLIRTWFALLSVLPFGQPLVYAGSTGLPPASPPPASQLIGGGCTQTGVSEGVAKILPDASSVVNEFTIAGGGGYNAASANNALGVQLKITRVRGTFSADLKNADGKVVHAFGVKTVAIIEDGTGAGAVGCNWHLIGESKSANQAADDAKAMASFFARLSAGNNDPSGFVNGPDVSATAEAILKGTTSKDIASNQTVSANIKQTCYTAGIFTPTGGWAAYNTCVSTCFAGEHTAIWATLMSCLGIVGTGATAAAGVCAAGCLGVPPCVVSCLEAVGVFGAGVAAGCLAGYLAACAGASAGCAIGCW